MAPFPGLASVRAAEEAAGLVRGLDGGVDRVRFPFGNGQADAAQVLLGQSLFQAAPGLAANSTSGLRGSITTSVTPVWTSTVSTAFQDFPPSVDL